MIVVLSLWLSTVVLIPVALYIGCGVLRMWVDRDTPHAERYRERRR